MIRFMRPAPQWTLANGRITQEELAELSDEFAPIDVALFRVFPLRGPKDLADLLVSLGFEFSVHAKAGVLRARLPRDANANRCSGYGFVQCKNASVAALLEQKVRGVTLATKNGEGNVASYCIGVGEVKTTQGAKQRKLKLEWKAIVAPGWLESTQREVLYSDICTAVN